MIERKDGRLLMFMRTYVGSFYKSYSSDGGATWSAPVDSGVAAPGAMPTLARLPTTGDILLLFNYSEPSEIDGPFPRNRMASAISSDEGETFGSIRILDGNAGFPGKLTMANVTFVGKNALIFYSKSPTRKNHYSWMQQLLPIQWFYRPDPVKETGSK